ncbi:MAG: mechanosensitive ion channel family protein [Steroidobacteraceae bacterium]
MQASTALSQGVASAAQIKNTIIDLAVRFGPRLFVAILILIIGAAVSRWVSRWSVRTLQRVELEPPVRVLLARAAWLLSFTLFLILALANLGVELLPLIAGLSVIGAGLALATQGVVGNLVAGLSILLTKPFRIGQYISIVAEEGIVDTITLFSTTLRHIDHSLVVIPNRKIVGEILHNFGTIRQLNIAVSISYHADVGGAVSAVREVLDANPHVLKEPPPIVQTNLLGDWSIVIGVRPWVPIAHFVAATGEINWAILEQFRRREIPIAVPQSEIRLAATAGEAGVPGRSPKLGASQRQETTP